MICFDWAFASPETVMCHPAKSHAMRASLSALVAVSGHRSFGPVVHAVRPCFICNYPFTAFSLASRRLQPHFSGEGDRSQYTTTTMGWRDEWPSRADGQKYDGKQLMELIRNNESPFHSVWDVKLLIREIEDNLKTVVTDIPAIYKGSNNYVRSSSCIRHIT